MARKAARTEEPELQLPEDDALPTEPIEIDLPGDPDGPTEVDLAPAPRPEPRPQPEPPAPEPSPLAEQVAAQRHAEELQRAQAEHMRQIRERDAQLAAERARGDDAEYNSVLTAIAAEQAVLDKAESDYAGFMQAGDFGNAAKAQTAMARTAARLDRLEDGKVAFEQRREQRKEAPAPEPAPQAPLDFEARIAQMPESAKGWLRKHPEFINDATLNKKIGAAHNYLVDNKGMEAFSATYFDALDEEFGFKAAPQPQPRRSMPVSAPVSRDVPTANGQRQASSKMTLTEEERRIARTSFTDPAGKLTNAQKELLYAQNKRKLQDRRANGSYPMPERN